MGRKVIPKSAIGKDQVPGIVVLAGNLGESWKVLKYNGLFFQGKMVDPRENV